jgi:hypothetical protein
VSNTRKLYGPVPGTHDLIQQNREAAAALAAEQNARFVPA